MKNKFKKGLEVENKELNKKKVAAVAAAVLAVGGTVKGVDMYQNYQAQNTHITIEQALENGATLEKLGITKETEKEINSIDKMLENEDIENNELMKLAPRINSLQFDIIKEKLAKTLNVDKDDISLYTETADEGKTAESVSIKNGEIFFKK
jgi:Tfp pilus assembly major pilin PilA